MVSGLDVFLNDKKLQNSIEGNIVYCGHAASVDQNLNFGPHEVAKIFGKRLMALWGPQHGLVCDVQDNMVETQNSIHPYLEIPVMSLYSSIRAPSNEMLKGVNTILFDLQDVGGRVYTYFSTLTLIMEAIQGKDISLVILDRPNPIGGTLIEGNILDPKFKSFVGRLPLPMRHGMTLGELALWAKKYQGLSCNVSVINGKWDRSTDYKNNGHWVLPSPNLPTGDGAYCFPGTVLFEGTCISEGRGTSRGLEIIGHPNINPFSLKDKWVNKLKETELEGFFLRPLYFMPTFQKHAGISCGGWQIHITNHKTFRPWALGQFLMRELYLELGEKDFFKQPPYEYENDKLPIDIINGTEQIRHWITSQGSWDELLKIEKRGQKEFLEERESCLLYGGSS